MPMISYAQNGEDVLLERVFAGVSVGCYVDVGANDPESMSVTKHFYDRGWTGVNVEPVPAVFERLQSARPRDVNLRVGVAGSEGELLFYELPDADVLSTFNAEQAGRYREEGRRVVERRVPVMTLAGVCERHVSRPIDFLTIDVEGLEREVIAGMDWRRWRPRVVLLEATEPNTQVPAHQDWEPLLFEAGYLFAYFDGLNRFYVRREEPELADHFRVPLSICDRYVSHEHARQVEAFRAQSEGLRGWVGALEAEVKWRDEAIAAHRGRAELLDAQLAEVQAAFRAADRQFREALLSETRWRDEAVAAHHARAEALQAQLGELDDAYHEGSRQFREALADAEARVAAVRAEADALQRGWSAAEGRLAEAQVRLAQAEGRFADTQGRLTDTAARLADAEGRLGGAEARLADAEGRAATAAATAEDVRARLLDTQDRLDQTGRRLADARSYAARLAVDLDATARDRDQAVAEAERWRSTYEAISEELRATGTDLMATRRELARFDGIGPMTIKIGKLIHTLSVRLPWVSRPVKSAARLAAAATRSVRAALTRRAA